MSDLKGSIQELLTHEQLPLLFVLGLLIVLSYTAGRQLKRTGLPMIVAYMITGIILGPSVTNVLDEALLQNMHFLTKGLLAFIAFKVGLEIDLKAIRKLGRGLMVTTLLETLGAAIVVTAGIYLLFNDLALALAMGALAPATAPAGTVAVIEQYRTKGRLTETLYSVVGIDDGLGIVLFGVISPFAILSVSEGTNGLLGGAFGTMLLHSFEEIGLSVLLGWIAGWLFVLVDKEEQDHARIMILTFGAVLLLAGAGQLLGGSVILSNMVFGVFVGNNKRNRFLKEIEEEDLGVILPFFFLIFFTIAGANLHIGRLMEVGLFASAYIVMRSIGKYGGAFLGSRAGGLEPRIQKNLGLTILSQAGVAIGLSLVIKQELAGMGPEITEGVTTGDRLGSLIFTTITASSVFFELLGPILAKEGLKRAGEINKKEEGG